MEEINIEFFNKDKHYAIVEKWWTEHNEDPIDDLPTIGLIAFKGEDYICAAWIIQTDTKKALLEHAISNPEMHKKLSPEDNATAGQALIGGLIKVVEGLGKYEKICVRVRRGIPKLKDRLEDMGFAEYDNNTVTLIRGI